MEERESPAVVPSHAVRPVEGPEPPPRVARSAEPPLTVLVAEDDEHVRALLTETLRAHGYCVLVARDGDEALALAAQEDLQIDCVATDQVMPGATGRELADHARLRWRRIPVLLFSGYELDADRLAAHFEGRVAFLRKPFAPSVLVTTVKALVADA